MQATQIIYALISVSVATIWSSPESPREIDAPALQNPVEISKWISQMTVDDKMELITKNLLDTQVLYGTVVQIEEEKDSWVKVTIPDQPSAKSPHGYPGWIPKRQLLQEPFIALGVEDTADYLKSLNGPIAIVVTPKTFLYNLAKHKTIELSYLTRLPCLGQDKEWVKVVTPNGIMNLKASDVRVYKDEREIPKPKSGQDLVEQGKAFLGLEYLWSGLSSYGYDCSGFSYSLHRFFGIQTPRDASDMAKEGKVVEKESLEIGDMVFFCSEKTGKVTHVGIYAGNNTMIHSPGTPKSIEITQLFGTPLGDQFCGARRYWDGSI